MNELCYTVLVAYATIGEIMISKRIAKLYRSGVKYRCDTLSDLQIGGVTQSYLLFILQHPGYSQEQIAKTMLVNKSNVTRQLRLLEKEGYIEKCINDEDKRSLLVFPTKKALDIKGSLNEVVEMWEQIMLDGLSQDEIEQLKYLLDKSIKNAKQKV